MIRYWNLLLIKPIGDGVYEDLGNRESFGHATRSQLQQLFTDCQTEPADYLLIRRLEELGDTVEEISDRLHELEAMGVAIIATEQPYTSENYPLGTDLLHNFGYICRKQNDDFTFENLSSKLKLFAMSKNGICKLFLFFNYQDLRKQ